MEQLVSHMSLLERFIYLGLLMGILCGLFPLILGLKRNKAKLAYGGFVLSFIGGILAGFILAAPFAALFSWLILKKDKRFEFKDEEIDEEEKKDKKE